MDKVDVAVYERCWRDWHGDVRRLTRAVEPGGLPVRLWVGGNWMSTTTMGVLPHTPCEDPSKPEWRTGMGVVHWALDNPGRELRRKDDSPYRYRASVHPDGSGVLLEWNLLGDWTDCGSWPLELPLCPVEGGW